MSPSPTPVAGVIRVAMHGVPAFQLRKGELGISVFDHAAVNPPLAEEEILDSFREGSRATNRTLVEIEARGLQVIPIEGGQALPERLRRAHREIRPGPGMTRDQF